MCSPQFSKSLLPNFVLVLSIIFISQHSSIFSSAQKMETNFPAGSLVSGTEYKAELRMQGALPTASRLTQCTGFVLTDPGNNPFWAVQVTGHAPSNIVHHLALYGCTSQPSHPCACNMNSRTTIFVSVKNTPAIRYPEIMDIYFGTTSQSGVQIGGASTIQYVFLEVHYHGALTTADTTTGVDLQYTTTPLTYFVGILSVMGVGTIPAGNSGYNVDTCLTFNHPSGSITVYGFQVHTHSLGRLVSIYSAIDFRGQWYVDTIGRGNPQFPQAYFPHNKGSSFKTSVSNTILLRCVYDTTGLSNPTHTIGVAGQVGTEMCFGSILYVADVLPPVNSFSRQSCSDGFVALFPASSTQLFPDIPKLKLHALYGNQTGVVSIDATNTMNLDLETF